MKGEQLPLSVQLPRTASYESYYPVAAPGLLDSLRAGSASLYLFGASGAGKTHLLQAAVRASRGAVYLPLAALAAQGPEVLEGLEAAPLVCLDDLPAVSADTGWALALLRLLDARAAQGRRLLLAAQPAPERLPLALPDLGSRLRALEVIGLRLPSSAEQPVFLAHLARVRGLDLAEDAARWLLQHHARDSRSLVQALDALDRAALSARRRLTLPFVMQTLPSAPDAPAPPAARTAAG
ncbi:MAG TPA: DnaA regulatory inactivator Hda [Nevskiaceae bacterium]|nr:DnaA regulatory inactivator Hda [Nevskiaceae bacterium]